MTRRQWTSVRSGNEQGSWKRFGANGFFYKPGIIANAPDPVSFPILSGKSLQGQRCSLSRCSFRPDEMIEQSLSRFITLKRHGSSLLALREVVERVRAATPRLKPRSASGESDPTALSFGAA